MMIQQSFTWKSVPLKKIQLHSVYFFLTIINCLQTIPALKVRITVMSSLCVAQISPPNEHIVLDSPWRPWWQRYQPTGYNLCSRSGSENELRDMITRCNNVGVNHFTAVIYWKTFGTMLFYVRQQLVNLQLCTGWQILTRYIYRDLTLNPSASNWIPNESISRHMAFQNKRLFFFFIRLKKNK